MSKPSFVAESRRGGPQQDGRSEHDQCAFIITKSATSAELVRTEPDATTSAITEALGHRDHLQKMEDADLPEAIGDIVREALTYGSAPPEPAGLEVR
jgi:cobalamin biosynthesis protein CobT